ncbi:MAG: DUF4190 domain-containing protein [Clostridia bacterium]|nr:DUF4190 domain-containing protein [Clostridia bacterium]
MEDNNEVINNGTNTVEKKINGSALASFILGIISLIIAGIPCGTAAVITGIIGLTKFDEEKENNKWMAIAGIILGVIGAVAAIILIPFVLKEFNI